jgi:RNA polymerase sigma-70 factor (sigma-E family)
MAERPEFADFVTSRSPSLLRTARLLTGDWASAEDLLQDSLALCWRRWSRISGNPEPYVHKVMVNTYLAWSRRFWTRERPTEVLPERLVDDDTARVVDEDELASALRRLPRRQRAVIVLRYYDDLSEAETAQILGIAVGTVKSQTSKALSALRVDDGLTADRARTEVG